MHVAALIQETEAQPIISPLVMSKVIANAKYSIYLSQTVNKDFECALKIFPKDKESSYAYCRERKIISSLDHENIIKYIPNVCFNNTRSYGCHFLPLEFAPHGDFFDLILSQELCNEKLVRTYFKQLVEAIDHMHTKEIAHLDLKLENILLGEDYLLKIADFDQSQFLCEKKLLYRGSPSFRAPEVLTRECQDFFAADMFSIGVILFAFATGEFPFLEKEEEGEPIIMAHYDLFCDNNEAFWELRLSQRTEKSMYNEAFKEIVCGLLCKDPAKRWTVKKVKDSRWYQGETLSRKELKVMMETIFKRQGDAETSVTK